MRTIKMICILFALIATSTGYSQFLDKLGEKAERAVERTVERRVERETVKSTDRALDSVIDAPKKSKKQKRKEKSKKKKGNNIIGGPPEDGEYQTDNSSNEAKEIRARREKDSLNLSDNQ
ncbi:hypothetical protein [Ulvibacter antarcticus]|uniref:Uncharacterized protein n=1 Tax=Ulvibacter antarcticus TaxID=442714 RepID=A0A3L9Y902_9FLAO|nr:hypothetical protein [Ulvibacter antarcticus]RMA57171.1 hypothetical protein BXY75_3058 [Ulvibacter antarcticus]